MPRKRTTLVLITVIIIAFVAICTLYSYKNIIDAVNVESAARFQAVASEFAAEARQKEDSDIGKINVYYGNGEVFIINKETEEVLYNSSDVKITPILTNVFKGTGTVADMELTRVDVDETRELILLAPERSVNQAAYKAEQAFVILVAVECFAFAAYIYLVFSSSKRAVERKLLEERLKKAEEADAAKALFVSNMSHDLRTPMSSSIGFAKLAYENANDPEKVRTYLKKVNSSNNHLLTLVNDIIDVSRIENGTVSIKEDAHNLFVLAAGIDEMVRPSIEAKKITFATDFSGIVDDSVFCDRIHLNQIFLNLFSNAEKFTEPGGTINFEITQRDCNEPGYGIYEFRVRDNGAGIGTDFIEHIYEPFSRENIAAVNRTNGAGLGLTITKNIIDLMDGRIAVKSEAGVGTEFVLRFKFKIAASALIYDEKSAFKGTVSGEKFKGKKLLLVDDNELNRDMLKDILLEYEFVIKDVDDGAVAVATIENAEDGEYAAILMDVQMPNMDGYEATRVIRSMDRRTISRTPIIAMTANAFDEDRQKSRDAGMNAHITKPVDVEKLLKVLDKLI
ncbi:MAG: response regulator [Clostridia bacterium]|nr:response regulator [Clostridia bacterium]